MPSRNKNKNPKNENQVNRSSRQGKMDNENLDESLVRDQNVGRDIAGGSPSSDMDRSTGNQRGRPSDRGVTSERMDRSEDTTPRSDEV